MQVSSKMEQYTGGMSGAGSQVSGTVMAGKDSVSRVQSVMNQLSAGKVFEGSILQMKDGQVLLGLSNGQTLQARLQADVNLSLGQSVFFQVKSNDGELIQIRPYLSSGNIGNPTLLSALQAASLSVTEQNVLMVDTMMQEQMGIDKQSLSNMARFAMQNPGIDLQTLVQMVKLNLPLSIENAVQFQNYQQDQGAVLTQLDSMMEELPQVLAGENLNDPETMQLNRQVLEILLGEEQTPGTLQAAGGEAGEGRTAVMPEAALSETEMLPQPTEEGGAVSLKGIPENLQQGIAANENASSQETAGSTTLQNVLSTQQQEELGKLLQQIGSFTENGEVFSEGKLKLDLTPERLLELIRQNLGKEGLQQTVFSSDIEKAWRDLFGSTSYRELVRDTLQKQWLLTPEQVQDKTQVSDLYDRLQRQMNQLEQIMHVMSKNTGPLQSTAANIQSNLEFMNQVNQFCHYVQLPLKMTREHASGELYVYSNKKAKQDPDGELSAFLHLDLDHLGSTDISVKLKGKEVDTHFYLEDEAAYQLILNHRDQLEEMLKQKGYHCKITAENEAKHVNLVEDFLGKDRAPKAGMVHRYSFDVKA